MIKTLSHAEFKRLADSLDHFSYKEQATLAILMYCGLRVGELIRLKLRDLTIENNTLTELHVPASISKSRVGRPVPIPPRARQPITDYIHDISPHTISTDQTRHLFPGSAGRDHMSVHGVEQLVERISRKILHKHVTPHMLRHTYATKLLKFSNTREVQLLLGHKKLSSTQIYTHPTIQDLTNTVKKAFT